MPKASFSLNTRTKITIESEDTIEPKILEILMRIYWDSKNTNSSFELANLAYQYFKKGYEASGDTIPEEELLEKFQRTVN